jgi:16S rRNA A1518/A1519 N6-dimethyltransferase RsmA/KsgA/DIM1 with predicted DNA glycosylase/AP lyase activity
MLSGLIEKAVKFQLSAISYQHLKPGSSLVSAGTWRINNATFSIFNQLLYIIFFNRKSTLLNNMNTCRHYLRRVLSETRLEQNTCCNYLSPVFSETWLEQKHSAI